MGYKVHIRYEETNNTHSSYALHILINRHEYGHQDETKQLVKTCKKGKSMNCREAIYIHEYHRKDLQITDQQQFEHKVLFDIIKPAKSQHD